MPAGRQKEGTEMKTKRIAWAIAVKTVGRKFFAIPSSSRTTRTEVIQGYYRQEHKLYERRRRSGTAKIIPIFANEGDLK